MSKRQRDSREYARRMRMIQERTAARKGRMRRANISIVAVLAVFAVMVVAKLGGAGGGGGGEPAAPFPTGEAAAAIVASLTSVPAATLDQVGTGSAEILPKPVTGQQVLTEGGKPLVLYVGAEYCPFCAAQRWPVVVALSRFGTFSGLTITASASDDVYPNTPTVSFHGSTYTSDVLTFQGVETSGRTRQGGSYAPLDQLTPQQAKVVQQFNAPPYVDAKSAGTIPFIDFANQALAGGASFSPELLAGMSAQQVTAALSDPDSEIAKAVLGNANAITTVLCKLTDGKPANVCTGPAATAFQGKIG
ncbi:DUF929 family protein [Dactylosporangium aurantiacum]|uniref:DUF929 family protein n=1 Tax=Dactylosporangium aurantiacum TaxID=35754 RepID=A0A9Q9MEC1_9ACTN|nr:DUF929 family protein [Dactylosporangium aurantiacum]MDG6102638.1 DUF929 family protein [Dactylosporangium aurantiacum]UWZ53109.1 DUF929 family protein [Dactylosporangium aurantiacum]